MPNENNQALATAWDAGYNTGVRRGVTLSNPTIAECVFQTIGVATVGCAAGAAAALAVGGIIKMLSDD